MSSDLDVVPIVAELRFNDYVSLAIATAVAYDYVITFSKEIHYIWDRPWTFVTALFALVRYMGMIVVLRQYIHTWTPVCEIVAQSMLRRPPVGLDRRTVLLFTSEYAFIVFLAAADIVMILRVYAIYNRSKVILGSLLILYLATIVLYSVSSAFYTNPETNMTMTTPRVLDMSFCDPEFKTTVKLGRYKVIPRLTLAALLLALVVIRSCLDSLQAYKETKRWKAREYVDLFAREGVIYFSAHLLNNVEFGQSAVGTIANAIVFTVMFVLSPRFVMSVRELHVRHVVGESGIDAGFGLSEGRCEITSSVGFAPSLGSRELEGDVEMQRVERTHGP